MARVHLKFIIPGVVLSVFGGMFFAFGGLCLGLATGRFVIGNVDSLFDTSGVSSAQMFNTTGTSAMVAGFAYLAIGIFLLGTGIRAYVTPVPPQPAPPVTGRNQSIARQVISGIGGGLAALLASILVGFVGVFIPVLAVNPSIDSMPDMNSVMQFIWGVAMIITTAWLIFYALAYTFHRSMVTSIHVPFYKIHAFLTVILSGASIALSIYLLEGLGLTFIILGAFPLGWFIYQFKTIKSSEPGTRPCPACGTTLPGQPDISFCPYCGRSLNNAK